MVLDPIMNGEAGLSRYQSGLRADHADLFTAIQDPSLLGNRETTYDHTSHVLH